MPAFFQYIPSILWFLLIISIIVFIHELGHFTLARLNGVKVEVFSIGFGPKIISWRDSKDTEWRFSALPLGGYVKMFGDADGASSPDLAKLQDLDPAKKQTTFYGKKLWQKALIVVAGPLANYLLAIVIFTAIGLIYGEMRIAPQIAAVIPESPAYNAGLQPGDVIEKINDSEINDFSDIKTKLLMNQSDKLHLIIKRNNESLELVISPQIIEQKFYDELHKTPFIGISGPEPQLYRLGIFSALQKSIVKCLNISSMILQTLWQLVTGQRDLSELGGPIRIAQYSGKSAEKGSLSLLYFVAMISLNLGVINLLPIPMLDGGHLFQYALQGVYGKPLPEKLQTWFSRIGLIFLTSLMAFSIFNDLRKLLF